MTEMERRGTSPRDDSCRVMVAADVDDEEVNEAKN